jgi:hypothetical protein
MLCCCALVKAQTKQDSIPQKDKQPIFIPTIGFSTLLGGYAKVGTWIKITNRFYGELGYAYYHYVDEDVPNEYIERTSKNKFLLGVNFLNKRHSFFQSLAVRKGFYKSYVKTTFRNGTFLEENNNISDIYYYTYNIGFMKSFSFNKRSIGVLTKFGVFWPSFLYNSNFIPPVNLELSLFYTL